MDTFYPSWKAYIDGKETKIYPVNLIGRGILIPDGIHTVEFRYSNMLFVGLILSTISLFILLSLKFFWNKIIIILN